MTQIRELETDPLFNSGRGSALTEKGTVEMEASIMDGTKRRCGAVSGITTVKNPISLARLVMDKSPHSYLAFSGAEDFARKQVSVYITLLPLHFLYLSTWFKSSDLVFEKGVEIVDNEYFVTDDNIGMLKLAKEANSILVCFDSIYTVHLFIAHFFTLFLVFTSLITGSRRWDVPVQLQQTVQSK